MTPTLTPTGAKPIPRKTEAKLSEAQGYLCEVEMQPESADKFRRLVANFLTAANSVTDVLINEIAAVIETSGEESMTQLKGRWTLTVKWAP